MLEIKFDDEKLKQVQRVLRDIPKALPRVMSRGLNRTATSARTQVSRFLSKRTGLKVKDVRSRLSLQKASYSNWRSAIGVSRKRVSLSLLGPKRTTRGLSVKHRGKRVTIRSAFPALKGWFIRQEEGVDWPGTIGVEAAWGIESKQVGRLPISRIKGPILSWVYEGAKDDVNRIQAESAKRLAKNIHDQVNLILKRKLPA